MASAPVQNGDGPVSSASANRRNGKLASCEPCRKRKTRCDHQQPICARCRRRGITKQCFYHPAPLTKPRERQSTSPPIETPGPMENGLTELDVRPAASDHTGLALPRLNRHLFGRTSSSATTPLPQSSHASFAGHMDISLSAESHDARVQSVKKLLSQVRHIALIEQLLRGFFADTASGLVPGALILPAVADLHRRWNQSHNTDALLAEIAEDIVRATTKPVDVRAMTSPSDFCKMHHGKNLRLEILGLIYTIAGRSCMYGLVHDGEERSSFLQDLFRCSNAALDLARDIAPEVTDTLIWLEHESVLLTSPMRGPATWRRMGELSSDILSLGLHREATSQSLPFFLVQMRRKMFAGVYHQDKFLATLMDRPPRLSKRHADCKPPFDLMEREILSEDPAELEQVQRKLSSQGWSTERRWSSAAWVRLRYHAAMVREEVLEYPYKPSTLEGIQYLRNLSKQNQDHYNSLPDHLRYSSDTWNSGLPNPVCFMLTATYLSYRQLDFQIYRLLEKTDGESLLSLLQASEDIVSTVITVGTLRTRASFLAQDFEFIILSYGLPSAATLATALECGAIPRLSNLPSTLSRSALIRKLSVFVSMLESLQSVSGTRRSLCIESANSISRSLDKVLDNTGDLGQSVAGSTPAPQPGYSAEIVQPGMQMLTSDVDPLFTNTNGLDLFDLPDWANNMDWADLGSDWMSL